MLIPHFAWALGGR